MFQEIRASLALLILFTLLTGVGYPLLVSGVGQSLFPHQAGGSLAEQNGTIIGSELIGQTFTSDKYFHSRPSAAGNGYDASNSSGSNLAQTSPDLIKTITARVADLRQGGDVRKIPADLVTASGSGLDPDISVASANFQASKVGEARNLTMAQMQALIAKHTIPRLLGFIGVARVNVLDINRELDAVAPVTTPAPAVAAPETSTSPEPDMAMPAAPDAAAPVTPPADTTAPTPASPQPAAP